MDPRSPADRGLYAGLFANAAIQRSEKWIGEQVAKRLRRKQRLIGDDPLEYHLVICEYALRHAGPDQLLHFNEMGRLPHVTVQAMLNSPPPHDGSFIVLEYPDPRYPKILYVEHVGGAMYDEDTEKVETARLKFKQLSKLALTPEETAAWIERLAAER